MVAVGNGTAEGARRGAADLVAKGATALLSFGVAGGLAPGLAPGTLVIPAAVVRNGVRIACTAALVARLGGPRGGPVFAGSGVVSTTADKARLHAQTAAVAIDLESGAVSEAALAAGLPFAVLRAICDPASRALPRAALVALDPAGRIQLAALIATVARRPAELFALLGLARDASAARSALSRHVRDLGDTVSGVD